MADVFLITIDALRYDHFNQDYFPKCWNHLQEFTRFKNAYANGVATPLSFPSIHTGYPVGIDGKLNEDTPTLAELYPGYTFGISNNPHLRQDRGYNRGFDSFYRKHNEQQKIHHHIREIANESQTLRGLYNWFWGAVNKSTDRQPDLSPQYNRTAEYILTTLQNSMKTKTGFFWVHLMDSHAPYYPQKVLDKKLDIGYDNNKIKEINKKVMGMSSRSMGLEKDANDFPPPTEEEIEFCRKVYGEIVKYIDRQLAGFLSVLKENDRWEESMIILMADHGEAFGEEGIFTHNWSANPIDSLIKVPLAVKYPNREYAGEIYEHPVQNADLLATLSNVLGWDVDVPPHTYPFTDPRNRPIVSKSNSAIRVTTTDGYAIRRGDSVVDIVGNIDDETLAILESSPLPSVESLSGEVPGLEDRERKELKERLEHLGYR